MSTELYEVADEAVKAMGRAYAPYSDYRVGAAVRTASGAVYSACNVEAKPSANTLHAEQRAMAKAVEAGEEEFQYLALATSGDELQPPCGNCLQTICSFDDALEICIVGEKKQVPDDTEAYECKRYSADELLPEAYIKRV